MAEPVNNLLFKIININEVLNELSANDLNFANFEELWIFSMDDKWGVEFP